MLSPQRSELRLEQMPQNPDTEKSRGKCVAAPDPTGAAGTQGHLLPGAQGPLGVIPTGGTQGGTVGGRGFFGGKI